MSQGSVCKSIFLAILYWAAWLVVITASMLLTMYIFQLSAIAFDYVIIFPPIAALLTSALIGLLQWLLVLIGFPGLAGGSG